MSQDARTIYGIRDGLDQVLRCRQEAVSPVERAKRGFDLLETAVKLTVAVELARTRQTGAIPPSVRTALAGSLSRPALGHWVTYDRLLAQTARANSAASELGDWLRKLETQYQLVKLRNRFTHGSAEDPATIEALEAVAAAVSTSPLLSAELTSCGIVDTVDGWTLHDCRLRTPDSEAQLTTGPLIYLGIRGENRELFLYQRADPRKAAQVDYAAVTGSSLIQPARCAAHFHHAFPLQRWSRPSIEPLGFAPNLPATMTGRAPDRAKWAAFLRTGAGNAVLGGSAGVGKTSLMRMLLNDLQGTSSETPPLPAVQHEPITIGYFIRRGTESSQASHYLQALLDAVVTAYKFGSVAGAVSDLDKFSLLQSFLGRIEEDELLAPLALLVDGLDESDRIGAFVPSGSTKIRVLVSIRDAMPSPDWPWASTAYEASELTGLSNDERLAMVANGPPTAGGRDLGRMLAASGGNPLYLRFATGSADPIDSLPNSLEELVDGLLTELSRRTPIVGPVLRVLAEFEESMPPAAIAELTQCSLPDVTSVLTRSAAVFVTSDADDQNLWSLVHDVVRARVRRSLLGDTIPARLARLTTRTEPVVHAATPFLIRRGFGPLLPDASEPDAPGADGLLADLVALMTERGHLKSRLKHQTAEQLLHEIGLVGSRLNNADLTRVVDSLAQFVVEASSDTGSLFAPEHVQSSFLRGDLGDLCRPLLDRLAEPEAVTAVVSNPDLAAVLTMAFNYGKASVLRRDCEPDSIRDALELLHRASSTPKPSVGLYARRYARELSRIDYDLGYIAFLQGHPQAAIQSFQASASAAEEGGDEIGRWIARCIAISVAFLDRALPGWLGQAGIDYAVTAFTGQANDSPHAIRWIHNARMIGFDLAFRDRDREATAKWADALADDLRARRTVPTPGPDLTRGRCHMIEGDWTTAVAELEPLVIPLLENGSLNRIEGAAREMVDLGVVYWHIGRRDEAATAWRQATVSSATAANWPWKALAERLLTEPGDDPWCW